MAGNSILQLSTQFAADQAQRNEAKKKISDTLRRVDQLIRKGDLDLAQGEIFKAKELEPHNAYTQALEERIYYLKSEIQHIENKEQKKELKENNGTAPIPIPKKEPELTQSVPESPVSKKINPLVTNTTKLPIVTASVAIPFNTSESEKKINTARDRKIELDTYRKALKDAWYDGLLTESETRQLKELRTLLEISDNEHIQIENNVRHECYQNAVKRYFSDNVNIETSTKSLIELRRKFRISEEEHKQMETQVTNITQLGQRDRILVIDDDSRLLELLQTSLEDNGFEVFALATSDEAFALLRKFTPDLILCDINLETSTMGGFTFYEKIQGLRDIQNVPFVFLTGLIDDTLVRAGKELGVDDFLMKPISERMLISALRGKLKRFKQLKKFAPPTKAAATG